MTKYVKPLCQILTPANYPNTCPGPQCPKCAAIQVKVDDTKNGG